MIGEYTSDDTHFFDFQQNLTELLPDRWGGYRQSHDTLPTVPGMSMDNPRTVHRQTVHAT